MPMDAEVHELLWERCSRVLEMGHLSFAGKQAQLCRLSVIDVEGVKFGQDGTIVERSATATTTVDLEIDESCCNISGNAHGGFLAWLIDHCSSLSLFCLAQDDRWTTSGVSTNINVFYISAAPLGTPVRVVSKVIQMGKVTATLEVRVENRDTGKLIALGAHVKQDVTRPVEVMTKFNGHMMDRREKASKL